MKQLSERLFVAGQISSADIQQAGAAGIKTIINNRPDGEEPDQLSHTEAATLSNSLGIDYHYLPMANGQPLPPTLVDDFLAVLSGTEDAVLAHCRSGMRSSVIWAIGQIQQGKLSPDQTIEAATSAGVPLANARALLESVQP